MKRLAAVMLLLISLIESLISMPSFLLEKENSSNTVESNNIDSLPREETLNFIRLADTTINLTNGKNVKLFKKSINRCNNLTAVNETAQRQAVKTTKGFRWVSIELNRWSDYSRLFAVDESVIGMMAYSKISFYSIGNFLMSSLMSIV